MLRLFKFLAPELGYTDKDDPCNHILYAREPWFDHATRHYWRRMVVVWMLYPWVKRSKQGFRLSLINWMVERAERDPRASRIGEEWEQLVPNFFTVKGSNLSQYGGDFFHFHGIGVKHTFVMFDNEVDLVLFRIEHPYIAPQWMPS